jgi:O-succinylbenzoate synthase
MRIEAAEIVRFSMPLVRPFRTSFGVQSHRDVLLVHLLTNVGEGWGECAAHESPFYNDEFVDASDIVLERWMLPAVFEMSAISGSEVATAIGHVKGYAAAKAATEMAVIDAELHGEGTSLADYLGGDRDRVEVGVSVGIADSIPQLLETVRGYVDQSYRRVKLKIEPGWDIEPVRAVRQQFKDLALQVDANASYSPTAIGHLKELDRLDLLMIEQPFAADDLEAHSQLSSLISTPICLDESILSTRSVITALDSGACSIVNIKVGRVGGLLEAKRIHDLCRSRNVDVWCGGMLETGIGRAANVALASLPGFTYPGDISGSDRYFEFDITEPFVVNDSEIDVPTGPGLGVSVDESVLAEYGAIRRVVLPL